MKQRKQSKIIAIVALCISVLGLSLGFAAFSNTLTISSSATVSPDSKDFKLRAYGILTADGILDISAYTLANKTIPSAYEGEPISMSDAVISEDGLKISNLAVTFKKQGEAAYYNFAIKNEGKYDAYLDISDYLKLDNGTEPQKITCTAKAGTRQDLVDQTCENIVYTVEMFDADGNFITTELLGNNNYRVIPAGSHIFLNIIIGYYDSTNILADGDFDVEIDDFTLEFSTVAPEK